MRIALSVRKSFEDNASGYFEKAKKAKRKLEGVSETIARFERELPKETEAVAKAEAQRRKKDWYEQYRWSFSSDGSLLIGGRDAGTNESIVKKHVEPSDTVFHTEAAGSPFTILKGPATEVAIAEAAQFCGAYSKAWKAGLSTTDVFWVKPEQLSKTANSGEFIARGAFMVRGEKHFLHPPVTLALGVIDGRAVAGVPALFASKGESYAILAPGKEKASDVARKLGKKLGLDSDDWLPLIPPGGAVVTGWKKATTNKKNAPQELEGKDE